MAPTVTNAPPKPGHADTLIPSPQRLLEAELSQDKDLGDQVKPQAEMLADSDTPSPGKTIETRAKQDEPRPPSDRVTSNMNESSCNRSMPDLQDIDFWQPKPPKVLMNNPRDIPLELRAQIHMYATTE